MFGKYGRFIVIIAVVLCAACQLEGDVSFDGVEHTISYNANGGTGSVPISQTAESGAHIVLPNADGLSKAGYVFGGWCANAAGTGTKFAAGSSYTMPNNDVTLYAFWNASGTNSPPDSGDGGSNGTGGNGTSGSGGGIRGNGTSLTAQLAWLTTNAVSGGEYTIEVSANETIDHQVLYYEGKSITIHLKGTGSTRIISLSSAGWVGSMFEVYSGITLILDSNITLQGNSKNTYALIRLSGNLIMNAGSKITGNAISGVEIGGGIFTMNGGEISGNSNSGVSNTYGTFTMNGGVISGNSGSGVTNRGTFTLNGGTISGNTASSGGGVNIYGGTMIKNGGTVYGYVNGDSKSNVAKGTGTTQHNGHAIYAYDTHSIVKCKDTTSGPGDKLYFGSDGSFSGAWDN